MYPEKTEKTVQQILKENSERQRLVEWYENEGSKVWAFENNEIGGSFWLLMAAFTKAGY